MEPGEIVNKPWGFEVLENLTDKLAVKRMNIKAGCRTSLQYHEHKTEVLTAACGIAIVEFYDDSNKLVEDYLLVAGDCSSITILPGVRHRTRALDRDVTILEVSTPELNDVVRLEDDYGRV